MKLRVALEDQEVVEDWDAFREEFEEAADRLDLKITMILHTDEEYL